MNERLISDLLFYGQIAQDGEADVVQETARWGCERYVALVEGLNGAEGPEVIRALIRSMLSPHDHGAYQATWGGLDQFRPEQVAPIVAEELPFLVGRRPDLAGELLLWFASERPSREAGLRRLNADLNILEAPTRAAIASFVREQEEGGWLQGLRGLVLP